EGADVGERVEVEVAGEFEPERRSGLLGEVPPECRLQVLVRVDLRGVFQFQVDERTRHGPANRIGSRWGGAAVVRRGQADRWSSARVVCAGWSRGSRRVR